LYQGTLSSIFSIFMASPSIRQDGEPEGRIANREPFRFVDRPWAWRRVERKLGDHKTQFMNIIQFCNLLYIFTNIVDKSIDR